MSDDEADMVALCRRATNQTERERIRLGEPSRYERAMTEDLIDAARGEIAGFLRILLALDRRLSRIAFAVEEAEERKREATSFT